MGVAGASKFLKGMAKNPEAKATSLAGADQVRANRSIFYKDGGKGEARTAKEVYQLFEQKMNSGDTYAKDAKAVAAASQVPKVDAVAAKTEVQKAPTAVAQVEPIKPTPADSIRQASDTKAPGNDKTASAGGVYVPAKPPSVGDVPLVDLDMQLHAINTGAIG
jgi:hypothetical protein